MQIQAERSTEQSFILFFLLGEFSLKRLLLAERTATKPLRVKRQIEFRAIPFVSVCFRLFPPVSVCFRLFPLNTSRKLRGTPQRSLPRWERCSPDAVLFCLPTWLPETETLRRNKSLSRDYCNTETWHPLKASNSKTRDWPVPSTREFESKRLFHTTLWDYKLHVESAKKCLKGNFG